MKEWCWSNCNQWFINWTQSYQHSSNDKIISKYHKIRNKRQLLGVSLERQAGFPRYDAVGYVEDSYIILLIILF